MTPPSRVLIVSNRLPLSVSRVLDVAWMERVLPILTDHSDRTPGALVEHKPAGLAWHYRMADPEYGPAQANELRQHLMQVLSNVPVEILPGNAVIEIRPQGIHKGHVVTAVASRAPDAFIVAIGDDATDEDMFAALPPLRGVSVRVGAGDSCAGYRVGCVEEVRAILKILAEVPAGARAQSPNLETSISAGTK